MVLRNRGYDRRQRVLQVFAAAAQHDAWAIVHGWNRNVFSGRRDRSELRANDPRETVISGARLGQRMQQWQRQHHDAQTSELHRIRVQRFK